jgi:hypothetical protein
MIDCRKCKQIKPEADFRPDVRYRRGFTSWCRDCHKAANRVAHAENVAGRTAKARDWRARNPEKALAISRKHHRGNAEARGQQYAEWARKNADKRAASAAKRKAAKLLATPSWVDWGKVAAFYAEAKAIQAKTGTPMHVDHIVPLQGKNVCGLYWEGNLQILTASQNVAKHNRLVDEAARQPDLLIPETRAAPVQEGFDL